MNKNQPAIGHVKIPDDVPAHIRQKMLDNMSRRAEEFQAFTDKCITDGLEAHKTGKVNPNSNGFINRLE
jgi:hypothetical protein